MPTNLQHSVPPPSSGTTRRRILNVTAPIYDVDSENKTTLLKEKSKSSQNFPSNKNYCHTPRSQQRPALAYKQANIFTSTPYAPPPPPPLSTKCSKNIINEDKMTTNRSTSPSVFVKSRKATVVMPRISRDKSNNITQTSDTISNSPVKIINRMKSSSSVRNKTTTKASSDSNSQRKYSVPPPPVVCVPPSPAKHNILSGSASRHVTRQSLALSQSHNNTMCNNSVHNTILTSSSLSARKDFGHRIVFDSEEDSDSEEENEAIVVVEQVKEDIAARDEEEVTGLDEEEVNCNEDDSVVVLSDNDDSDYSPTKESSDESIELSFVPSTNGRGSGRHQKQRRQQTQAVNSTNEARRCIPKARNTPDKQPTTTTIDATTNSESDILYSHDLRVLLQSVSQTDPIPFQEYLDNFSIAPRSSSHSIPVWTKLGEATYSEVFMTTLTSNDDHQQEKKIVMKIIPLMNDFQPGHLELPDCTDPKDVSKEIKITKELSSKSGFVKLLSSSVVYGKYPKSLMNEWNKWLSTGKSENISPDVFEEFQRYAILCLPYNGTDLDNYNIRSWKEALSVFVQVVESLTSAETDLKFEHRDLHCGNILVHHNKHEDSTASLTDNLQNLSLNNSRSRLSSKSSDDKNGDIQTVIIDYSLSRMETGDDIIWADISHDEQLFEGQGDYQYDVYRIMRLATNDDWKTFQPSTNVLWLHFLAYKLSKRDSKPGPCQRLRVPIIPESSSSKSKSRVTVNRLSASATTSATAADLEARQRRRIKRQERLCYDILVEIERTLAVAVNSVTGSRRGGARMAKQVPMKNAADVSLWVKEKLASSE